MSTWEEAARDNRTAAHELLRGRRWRSCGNRAYYAVYSGVTHGLIRSGTIMSADRPNPRHAALTRLIASNLTLLSPGARSRLAGIVEPLYNLRVVADYQATLPFDERMAGVSIVLITRAFAEMQVYL